jgi:hypothetical protein
MTCRDVCVELFRIYPFNDIYKQLQRTILFYSMVNNDMNISQRFNKDDADIIL